jgi:transcriptional regulator with XRE-family HTH domain
MRGLTLDELANMVGSSRQHLIKLESGQHRPRADTLRRLASALDLSPEWFLGGGPTASDDRLRLARAELEISRLWRLVHRLSARVEGLSDAVEEIHDARIAVERAEERLEGREEEDQPAASGRVRRKRGRTG